MNRTQLRELGNQCLAAADHLDDCHTRGVAAPVGAFNWLGLITLITQMLPALLSLFTGPHLPPPPTS